MTSAIVLRPSKKRSFSSCALLSTTTDPRYCLRLDNAALDMQTIEWGRILDRRMAEYDRQIAQMRQADRDRGPDQGYGY